MKVAIALLLASLAVSAASPQFDFINNLFGRQGRQRGRGSGGRNRGNRGGGGGGCNVPTPVSPNYNFGGEKFLVSWRLVGCSSFTQSGAEAFCRANKMRPISIDSSAKEREFLNLVARERQRYFWTGGKVRGRSISWPSGRKYNNVNWSNTGGAGREQPDNREGNEECLAVLNNFYKDGIRFHDVSCHHKKPVICQA